VLVGFVAQMIDGALGMAYGVSSKTFLLSIGVPPAGASASVHMTEFVTIAESVTFVLALTFIGYWQIILGLLIGGAIAAPIAAVVARKLPVRDLMFMVGVLIVGLSIRTIWMSFG